MADQTPRRINVELLDRIEQQITAQPETWRQSVWFELPAAVEQIFGDLELESWEDLAEAEAPCGTAYCVAGWAAVLSGWRPDMSWMDEREAAGDRFAKDGRTRHAAELAEELIGLDPRTAFQMFSEENSLADLQRLFAELREEASR